MITGKGKKPDLRKVVVVAMDPEHDLALLKIGGTPLPVMQFGKSDAIQEGRLMAYTGFPIGMVLGFTQLRIRQSLLLSRRLYYQHITLVRLDASKIRQLKKDPFMIFQLDGIAYPGSSGSPLYDPDNGQVYGILNMVFVKGKKESALTNPSGIATPFQESIFARYCGIINFSHGVELLKKCDAHY